jgi:hypothetical protein
MSQPLGSHSVDRLLLIVINLESKTTTLSDLEVQISAKSPKLSKNRGLFECIPSIPDKSGAIIPDLLSYLRVRFQSMIGKTYSGVSPIDHFLCKWGWRNVEVVANHFEELPEFAVPGRLIH